MAISRLCSVTLLCTDASHYQKKQSTVHHSLSVYLCVCVCVYMYVSFRDRYHLFQLLLIFVLLNIYYSVAQAR